MTNPAIIPVDPLLSIQDTLALAALELDSRVSDMLGFQENGRWFVASRDDLTRMAGMGLDALPFESIAIPETSPLLHRDSAQPVITSDYSKRLTAFFPVYFVAALYELQSLMQRYQLKGYVIGGITRDLLHFNEKRMNVEDVDITVEGDALAFAAFLTEHSRNFFVQEHFPEFGTAKIRYKDSLTFDLASTRQEIYPHCGSLPILVNRGVPLVNDIVRRDFTINSLAFSIHSLGHVLDYANGIQDIQMRQMRVLHPLSFFEDPSRILRAIKFCARFDFELGEETHTLLNTFIQHGVSCYKGGGDRIKQELKGLLSIEESDIKSRWVSFFISSACYRLIQMDSSYIPSAETVDRLSALGALLPEVETAVSTYKDPDFRFDIYLCFLFADIPEEDFQRVSARLGMTRNERELVEQFRQIHNPVSNRFSSLHEFSSPAEIYDLFHGLHFIAILANILTLGFTERKRFKIVLEAFVKYKRKWENQRLELNGNDLIELGIPKGKMVGQVLNQLLHAKLIGQLAERLDEIQFVKNYLSKTDEAALDASNGSVMPKPETNTGLISDVH